MRNFYLFYKLQKLDFIKKTNTTDTFVKQHEILKCMKILLS